MFFKKKKTMSEQTTENNKNIHPDTDNLSQNEAMDEALGNVLNADESRISGQDLVNEGMDEEMDKLQGQLQEQKEKYLRLVAEFENYKKRTAREKEELRQTAGKEVMQSLLVVLDDMDRAAGQLEKTDDLAAIKEGVSLVFNKMRSVTQQKGLQTMNAKGEEFNPDLHEAITEIPAPDDMKGKVIDVVEPGYYLNDKLIRFAKVVVGK